MHPDSMIMPTTKRIAKVLKPYPTIIASMVVTDFFLGGMNRYL